MISIAQLWLPILLSAVGVFVVSAIIWMALPIHKKDYKKLGSHEDAVRSLVKSSGLAPGMYMFPACDPKTLKDDPAAQQKAKDGPWGLVMIMPCFVNMGKTLGLWMVNLLVISTLVGYVAAHSLALGASMGAVARIVGTVALLAYGGNALSDSIWKGRPWALLPGSLFDAIMYAIVTAAIFGALWPNAA